MSDLVQKSKQEGPRNSRKIIVMSNHGIFSEDLIHHSVQLAGRLGYDLVALSVDTRYEGTAFENRSSESAKKLCSIAGRNSIHCSVLVQRGEIEFAVEEAIHQIRRVEIVIIDSATKIEAIRNISVPVVSVVSAHNDNGGSTMSAQSESSKIRAIGKTAGYGVLSAACYAAVFTHADSVTQLFARGGWCTVLPIATVLAFSFVHGAFAHNLWSLLGIEAQKRDQVRQTEHKVAQKRKQLRKRPRVHAYVNPFHRIDV